MRKPFSAFLLAGVTLIAMSSAVMAEALRMGFDVYVSGLRVMKVNFDGDITTKTYRGAVRIRPKGFAKLFLKKRLEMRTQGVFNDAHAKPQEFRYHSRKKSREKSAVVRWQGGRVVSWTRKPPASEAERRQVLAAIASGALDPLSALFTLGRRQGANLCSGRFRVFDGLDVYDLKLVQLGQTRVGNMNYAGPALKCRMIYVPIAGMSEKKKRKQLRNPPVFTVWLARVKSAAAGPIWVPVQASGRLKGRPFTASLSAATLGGGPLRAATN